MLHKAISKTKTSMYISYWMCGWYRIHFLLNCCCLHRFNQKITNPLEHRFNLKIMIFVNNFFLVFSEMISILSSELSRMFNTNGCLRIILTSTAVNWTTQSIYEAGQYHVLYFFSCWCLCLLVYSCFVPCVVHFSVARFLNALKLTKLKCTMNLWTYELEIEIMYWKKILFKIDLESSMNEELFCMFWTLLFFCIYNFNFSQ